MATLPDFGVALKIYSSEFYPNDFWMDMIFKSVAGNNSTSLSGWVYKIHRLCVEASIII